MAFVLNYHIANDMVNLILSMSNLTSVGSGIIEFSHSQLDGL